MSPRFLSHITPPLFILANGREFERKGMFVTLHVQKPHFQSISPPHCFLKVAVITHRKLGGWKQQKFASEGLGGQKCKIKVWSGHTTFLGLSGRILCALLASDGFTHPLARGRIPPVSALSSRGFSSVSYKDSCHWISGPPDNPA